MNIASTVPERDARYETTLPDAYNSDFVGTRRVATLLLLIMAAIFAATHVWHSDELWVQLLRAFCEAGLVGGLADWFAVTALFRRPLGLPIPHTAIIPNNRSRIGRSLGSFIEKNFLTPEILETGQINLSLYFLNWAEKSDNRSRLMAGLKRVLPKAIAGLRSADLQGVFAEIFKHEITKVNVAQLFARALTLVKQANAENRVIDEAVSLGREFFRANQTWIRESIKDASPWFIPDYVDQKIFEAIVIKTEQTLTDALEDPQHELRKRLLAAFDNFIVQLETSPKYRAMGEELKATVLASQAFHGFFGSIKGSLLDALLKDMNSQGSKSFSALEEAITRTLQLMARDHGLQNRINQIIRSAVTDIVGGNRKQIVELIARTVESWDATSLVERLESQVGRDLQYIRMNGTIVGGLVGVLIYGLSTLLAR